MKLKTNTDRVISEDLTSAILCKDASVWQVDKFQFNSCAGLAALERKDPRNDIFCGKVSRPSLSPNVLLEPNSMLEFSPSFRVYFMT
jgi:hypothetical protein